MFSSTRQTIESTKHWLMMIIPSLTMFVFIGFAFFIGVVIVLSIIPVYIQNISVARTRFVLTTVQMNNYYLYMTPSVRKRDLTRLISPVNTSGILTLDAARSAMNSSIQYALEQQLNTGDNQDQFNVYILNMASSTNDPSNMSLTLNFLIAYTRECISCDNHRQSIIFKQLCSNNQLSTPIRFLIEYANLSYTFSNPVILHTSRVPIQNITIITKIVSSLQFVNVINSNTGTNGSTQVSNKFLAKSYTLAVTTTKSNYFATLDQVGAQVSASQNDGPVSLIGAVAMYPELAQTIGQQAQYSNSSNALNITINQIILQFWYSNSTIQVIVDFLINFSTYCDNQCTNQRSIQLANQLGSLTNKQIHIQPSNITDGQVQILKNGVLTLFSYSLTAQIISNFTGTIIQAISPLLTIIY